jgi:hypothetical protein
MNVGRFYLRELEVTNFQATARLDASKIALKPVQLALNGAPVRSMVDLDLGVPGYQYALDLSAIEVPFAPLVNTFQPERRGQMGGALTASATLSGIGTSGEALQKTLTGKFDFGTTNLNLSIGNVKSRLLKSIINVIAIVPELRKNPNAALGSLAGALLGSSSSSQSGGWSDELAKSPINIVQARGNMGSGRVTLDQALVQSPAFEARTRGDVALVPVLTNSPINFPLTISVRRPLAEKINFVPAGTPTNAIYVKLPDYVTVKGTVGNPKTDINKMALLGSALEQLGGNIPGVDQKTGNLIKGLGGMLTGPKAQVESPSNAPQATNQAQPGSGLPGVLGGLLGGQQTSPSTNRAPAAVTNTPQTNASPVGNLLNNLLGPKKK